MSRLPMVCGSCVKVSLVAFSKAAPEQGCATCGAALRVVPGCSYAESDVALFEELNEALGSGLQASDAQRLALEIERGLWSGKLAPLFVALSERWPGITPLVTVTGNNHGRQKQVLRMVKTIFDALASTQRSGTMLAVKIANASGT